MARSTASTRTHTKPACQCGDRSRPGLNHTVTKPCWGWLDDRRITYLELLHEFGSI
jgi:hypothetical protein